MVESYGEIIKGSEAIYHQVYGVDQVNIVIDDISLILEEYDVILFVGELGAGKTTLIKALLKEWGVEEELTSPTFAIVNTYKTKDGNDLHHMDLYRLKNLEEAIEIGIEDMIDSGHKCVIEWPEKAMPFLSNDYVVINIEHLDFNSRKISVYLHH